MLAILMVMTPILIVSVNKKNTMKKQQTHIFHAFRGVTSNKFLSKMLHNLQVTPQPRARIWTF